VPRVIERSAIVGDGQLVDFLGRAARFPAQSRQSPKALRAASGRAESNPSGPMPIDQFDDSQASIAKSYRHRDDRLRLSLGLFVHLRRKTACPSRCSGTHYRLAVLRDPAGNSLPNLDAPRPSALARPSPPLVQSKAPVLASSNNSSDQLSGRQKFIDLLHNSAEKLIELQRRTSAPSPNSWKTAISPLFPLFGPQPRIAAAFYGRKLIYILHSGSFLSLAESELGNAPARSRHYGNAKKRYSRDPRLQWRISASIGSS